MQEIREQLSWREKNRDRAAQFCTARSFGDRTKLYLDETHRWLAVTRSINFAADNPDVLDFSAVTGCRTDIEEHRTELKYETKNTEGKVVHRSYSPPRYEYDYDFYVTVCVNVPYFSEMKFQLNERPVHIPYRPATITWSGGSFVPNAHEEPLDDPYYRRYKEMSEEVCALLEAIRRGTPYDRNRPQAAQNTPAGNDPFGNIEVSDEAYAEALNLISWMCPSCRIVNSGTNVCRGCGAPLTDAETIARINTLARTNTMMRSLEKQTAGAGNPTPGAQSQSSWNCPACGAVNQGAFCESCGTKKPGNAAQCSRCGWKPAAGAPLPKFCPECGQPF